MTLTLDLSEELVQRLVEAAFRQGVPVEQYAASLLDQSLPSDVRRAEIARRFQAIRETGDAEEQRETGDYLIRVLDEDRLSNRPLFPPELQGITW